MKQITDHHDGHGLAEKLKITATDAPGPGGAHHDYTITYGEGGALVGRIQFQKGARDAEGSTAGALDQCLLAIVLDRMRDFNAGPFPARENAIVITKIEETLHWMRHRVDGRAKRGVLGKELK